MAKISLIILSASFLVTLLLQVANAKPSDYKSHSLDNEEKDTLPAGNDSFFTSYLAGACISITVTYIA